MRHAIVWSVLLAVTFPGMLLGQDGPADIEKLLGSIGDGGVNPDDRATAREQILKAVSAASLTEKTTLCRQLAGKLVPLINSPDPQISMHACKIAADVRHVALVPTLTAGLASKEAAVRYWSAKGLADIQFGMYSMGDRTYFDEPIKALAEQGLKEDNAAVVQEVYRALGVSEQAKMDKPARNAVIYQAFMKVYRERAKRLADRKLDHLSADVQAANSALQWSRMPGLDRKGIIRTAAQVLGWAGSIYFEEAEQLVDQQKAALEHLMLRASEVIGSCLIQSEVAKMPWSNGEEAWPREASDSPRPDLWEKQAHSLFGWTRAHIRAGKTPELGLHILNWVGSPDIGNFKLKAIGIEQAAALNPKKADVVPPATQPADGDADEDTDAG